MELRCSAEVRSREKADELVLEFDRAEVEVEVDECLRLGTVGRKLRWGIWTVNCHRNSCLESESHL